MPSPTQVGRRRIVLYFLKTQPISFQSTILQDVCWRRCVV